MMKKIMTAGFWALLLLPNLLFPLIKNSGEQSTGENRKLAEFPVFSTETYAEFPAAVNSYINDHAAFRNLFLSINSVVNRKVFGYADSQDVIVGKDGWYFFAGGRNLHDALGVDPLTEGDTAWIGDKLIQASEYYESQGIDFVAMIAPNKEGIYPEYMPEAYGRVGGETRPDQVEAYVREHSGIEILDPRAYFNANRDYLWYYKTDTHWNHAGAYAASQMLIEALGGEPCPIEEVEVDYVNGEPGDLVNLFHLPESYCDEYSAQINGYYPELDTVMEDVNGDKNIVHTSTPDAPDQRRVAVIRDSFGGALMGYLPKYFANVDFYHWQVFDRSLLEENPPDAVIYLIVERELTRIPEDVDKMLPEQGKERE